MSRKRLILLLLLELLALIAAALAFAFIVESAAVSTDDEPSDVIQSVGNTVSESVEGVVVSMDSDSICLSGDGETIELYCATPSVKFQLEEIEVGDTASVVYFDEGDSDPHRYHAYAIEKLYKEPPSPFSP